MLILKPALSQGSCFISNALAYSFGRMVLQIAIHSFIHLLINKCILNTKYTKDCGRHWGYHNEEMDKNSCLHVAHIFGGRYGVQNK